MINDRSINENDYTIHVEGIEDVKQSWRRILRTVPGAVRMNPTFGCDLYKYIDFLTQYSIVVKYIYIFLTKIHNVYK